MITIVEYEAGNPTSVQRALAAMGVGSVISGDADVVRRAERIVFPGVGRAVSTMEVLSARGLDQALREAHRRGAPFLGICIGAQVVLERSEEDDTTCLGLLPGRVRRFPKRPGLKVPHMGWNRVRVVREHPVLAGLPVENELYFVHSYYPEPAAPAQALTVTEHGLEFTSSFAHENLIAMQFHAEKSGPFGLGLLERFASWRP